MTSPPTNGLSTHQQVHLQSARPGNRSGMVVVPAVGLGILAGLLSLVGSWHVSLWTDESATISGATRSLPELWQLVHNIDAVHGTYYAFMHFWIAAFGSSPVSLRLPSAIAVGLATAGVFFLGGRLSGGAVGVLGALAFAIMPRVTWMGIEARSYAFTAAGAVWLTVLLVSAVNAADSTSLRGRQLWRWIGYALIAAASIAVNIYVVLLLGAHALSLMLHRRISWRLRWTWLTSAVTGFLLASPVLYQASQQSGQLGGERYSWFRLLRNVVVNQYFLGDTPTIDADDRLGVTTIFSSGPLWQVAAVLLAGIGTAVIIWALAAFRHNDPEAPIESGDFLRWLVPWVVLPTLLLGVYSVFVGPLYNPRYLAFSTPAIAVLLGYGIFMLRPRWLRIVVSVTAIALIVPIYASQRAVNAKSSSDWVQVAEFIQANARAGEAVYFAPRYPVSGEAVGQTSRGILTAYPNAFEGLADITFDLSPATDASLTGKSRILANSLDSLDGVDTLWVIRRNGDPAGTEQTDNELLTAAGFHAESEWTGSLDSVTKFARR